MLLPDMTSTAIQPRKQTVSNTRASLPPSFTRAGTDTTLDITHSHDHRTTAPSPNHSHVDCLSRAFHSTGRKSHN